MLKSARLRLFIGFMLLTIAGVYWAFFGTPQPLSTSTPDDPNRVDFFIRDAFITKFDEQGQIEHIITSPLLQHFPVQERTTLETPFVTLPNDTGDMQISSDEGFMLDDETKIELAGNVQVIDNSTSEVPWVLTTAILTFLPPENYAETEAPVLIVQGQNRTDAIGMKAWFNERQVDLLSEVRGYYVTN
ncbi:LPS export ABC transporter periplasmic protein LptC [Nitrincola schmidtii]|uniref:LPS export ABC transporter periplasmic protein LptC n=1 Tax=Nitrincola schmidtii TaxID=1730894 RepID=UPI00124E4BD9|nr:LPS export ABC transporter periplasmic protein LptC [Nitrincola schmidtii]